MSCECGGQGYIDFTEEMIMNYDMLPAYMKGWRRYRIEYGFECGCPEGLIYLPPHIDINDLDKLLNSESK